jgi:hypothetical protein
LGEEKMEKRRSLKNSIFILLAVLALNTLTYADIIYNFNIFNNPAYENDSRLNLTMTVSDEGLNNYGRQKVGFTFNNNSTATSSITDIYFDSHPGDSALNFNYVSIIEGSGVNFSKNANPKSLPGGEELNPKFDNTPEYSADSDSPVSQNGINSNEWLMLIFTLDYNKTIDDVILEIANGDSSCLQSLRVGIHIQSLSQDNCYDNDYDDHQNYCPPPPVCDDSASAINCTEPIPEPIPEPATICLLAIGSLAFIGRKNKNK